MADLSTPKPSVASHTSHTDSRSDSLKEWEEVSSKFLVLCEEDEFSSFLRRLQCKHGLSPQHLDLRLIDKGRWKVTWPRLGSHHINSGFFAWLEAYLQDLRSDPRASAAATRRLLYVELEDRKHYYGHADIQDQFDRKDWDGPARVQLDDLCPWPAPDVEVEVPTDFDRTYTRYRHHENVLREVVIQYDGQTIDHELLRNQLTAGMMSAVGLREIEQNEQTDPNQSETPSTQHADELDGVRPLIDAMVARAKHRHTKQWLDQRKQEQKDREDQARQAEFRKWHGMIDQMRGIVRTKHDTVKNQKCFAQEILRFCEERCNNHRPVSPWQRFSSAAGTQTSPDAFLHEPNSPHQETFADGKTTKLWNPFLARFYSYLVARLEADQARCIRRALTDASQLAQVQALEDLLQPYRGVLVEGLTVTTRAADLGRSAAPFWSLSQACALRQHRQAALERLQHLHSLLLGKPDLHCVVTGALSNRHAHSLLLDKAEPSRRVSTGTAAADPSHEPLLELEDEDVKWKDGSKGVPGWLLPDRLDGEGSAWYIMLQMFTGLDPARLDETEFHAEVLKSLATGYSA